MAKTVEGIQINEDRAHQRREWRIERIGWVIMALLLLASLAGLLGDGPLGRAHAGQPGTLSLDYDRLQRTKAPTAYLFRFDPAIAADGMLRLRFDDRLLENVEIDTIVPEPDSVRTGPGFTEYAFAVAPGDGEAMVHFQYQPTTFGRVAGQVTAEGAPPLRIEQFIYP